MRVGSERDECMRSDGQLRAMRCGSSGELSSLDSHLLFVLESSPVFTGRRSRFSRVRVLYSNWPLTDWDVSLARRNVQIVRRSAPTRGGGSGVV